MVHQGSEKARIRRRLWMAVAVCGLLTTVVRTGTLAQDLTDSPPEALKLSEAVICETIRSFKPVNRGAVFPVSVGKLFCFTAFQNIPDRMYIHHHWYRRDELVTRRGLQLQPPSWSTASSIEIREADKGPWRVEITDDRGQILKTLRFSITD